MRRAGNQAIRGNEIMNKVDAYFRLGMLTHIERGLLRARYIKRTGRQPKSHGLVAALIDQIIKEES